MRKFAVMMPVQKHFYFSFLSTFTDQCHHSSFLYTPLPLHLCLPRTLIWQVFEWMSAQQDINTLRVRGNYNCYSLRCGERYSLQWPIDYIQLSATREVFPVISIRQSRVILVTGRMRKIVLCLRVYICLCDVCARMFLCAYVRAYVCEMCACLYVRHCTTKQLRRNCI